LGGGFAAISGAGAGASTHNRVRTLIKAYIDDDEPTASGSPSGITASSVSVSADDHSSITTSTASVALAGAVGLVSGSAAISLALARNEIANEIEAAIKNAGEVHATGTGGITVEATDTATINATTTAASVSVGVGFLGTLSIAGGGADAFNTILTT